MLVDLMLILVLLSTGLFAGLMMTLVVIMQRQWDLLEKEEYIQYFRDFLLIAKGNPIITLLTLASFILPFVIGIIQLTSGNVDQGWIAIAAGVVFFLGCFGVTMRLNFPIYNQVIGWKDAASVSDSDVVAVRKRFYRLNIIRMTSAGMSFILLGIGIFI